MKFTSPMFQGLRNFWLSRSQREKTFLSLAGVFLTACLIWFGLWQPAMEGRARLAKRNAILQAQLAGLTAMAPEVARLRAQPPAALPPEQIKPRLEGILASRGLKPRLLETDAGTRQTRLELECQFDVCLSLLDAVRKDSHWTLSRARFEASPQAGVVRAQLAWSLP